MQKKWIWSWGTSQKLEGKLRPFYNFKLKTVENLTMPKATPVSDITPKTGFPLPNRAFYKKMAEKAKK